MSYPPDALLTPTRMRRLAAAMDGEPPGEERWVTMSLEAPHVVAGVFDTQPKAMDAMRSARPNPTRQFGVFGPFANGETLTPLAGGGNASTPVPPGCVHFGRSEIWCYPRLPFFDDIRALLDRTRIDDPLTGLTAPGATIDAVFFGRSAFAKFVHPHLVDVHGLGGAVNYLAQRGSAHY